MTITEELQALAQEIRDESFNRLSGAPTIDEETAARLAMERLRNRRAIDQLINTTLDEAIAAARAARREATEQERGHEAKVADDRIKELQGFKAMSRLDLVLAVDERLRMEAGAASFLWSTLHQVYADARTEAVKQIDAEMRAERDAATKAKLDLVAGDREREAEARLKQAGL